ncbi:MAG: zinc-dependent metalloprotease [Actinomycetota bacterium]|nr:zinc-dependent metalloprotease [Actinomycetota bacterium]
MIDWIIAERIATWVAGTGDASPPTADLRDLAAESEVRVTAYTGLEPAQPLPEPEGINRREWVRSNVASMRLLLDPVLESTGKGFGPLGPAMQIGAGLILSTEVGVVLGYLGQRVLGQYELVLLDEAVEDRPPRLLFVMPNLGQAVQAFGAEEREFMTWVALHEVTHAIQFAGVPWLHRHLAGLVRELLRSAELRIEAPRQLRIPTGDEVRRVLRALREGDLITVVTTHAERETLDRVQAVMAVIEGHAEHVMDAVAPDLIPSLAQLRAALDRRRRSQSGLSRVVARLLGLNLKLRQYEQGKKFCDAIVHERGVATLHHVFSGPEAMPTLAELQNPLAWIERTSPPG